MNKKEKLKRKRSALSFGVIDTIIIFLSWTPLIFRDASNSANQIATTLLLGITQAPFALPFSILSSLTNFLFHYPIPGEIELLLISFGGLITWSIIGYHKEKFF